LAEQTRTRHTASSARIFIYINNVMSGNSDQYLSTIRGYVHKEFGGNLNEYTLLLGSKKLQKKNLQT